MAKPFALVDPLGVEAGHEKGKWPNERRVANEGWDTAVYCHAAFLKFGGHKIDWSRLPAIAEAEKQAKPVDRPPPPVRQQERRSFFRVSGRP